jgi:hypothetical protein
MRPPFNDISGVSGSERERIDAPGTRARSGRYADVRALRRNRAGGLIREYAQLVSGHKVSGTQTGMTC